MCPQACEVLCVVSWHDIIMIEGGEGKKCHMIGLLNNSLDPRPSSPRFYLAALEKNRGVRPETVSHVMRAADVTAIIL